MEHATAVRDGRDTLVGYRLIRRVGSGSRAEVFLARESSTGAEHRPVALKVFRRQTDPALVEREVHALLTTRPGTLARLEDVATTPDGRVCAVLEYLPGLPLDRLLAGRGRIDAAEIVTVAATLTATLQALHDVGLSHPTVRPSCVRFDGRGRPVLLGLGALEELPSGVAGVARRRDAVVGLTGFLHGLLAYLDPSDSAGASVPSLLAEFESTTVARPFPADLAGLEAALFAWAAAGPVRNTVIGAPADERAVMPASVPRLLAVAASGGGGAPVIGPPPATRGQVTAGRLTRALAVRGRAVANFRLGAAVQIARSQAERFLAVPHASGAPRSWRRGARPVLVGVGLVVVLSIGGVAVLSVVPAPGERAEEAGGVPSAADAAVVDEAVVDEAVVDAAVVEGDDPAAAVLALLRRREACLAAASVLCLDGVDQPGSVAMADDGYRIRQVQSAPSPPPGGSNAPTPALTAVVQERTGNSALVVIGRTAGGGGAGVNDQPASALVIKGEAGWRLRELFDY